MDKYKCEKVECIRAIKVLIAGLLTVYISGFFGVAKGSTMALTVFLLLVLYPSTSGSRKYIKQRFLANIYAFFITSIVHPVFNGSLYGLPIVFSIIIITNSMFKLNKKISLVSSAAGALILYIGSDILSIASRFISLAIGSIIAIIINEFILPVNSGEIVEDSLMRISNEILSRIEEIIKTLGNLNKDYNTLENELNKLTSDLSILKDDIKIISTRIDFKSHKDKIDTYINLQELCIVADEYLSIFYKDNIEFLKLDKETKEYILYITKELYLKHKRVIENLNNLDYTSKKSNFLIDNSKIDMSKKINILLMSKLIEYEEVINKF